METEKRLIYADELKRRIIAFATGCHTTYLTVDNIIMLLNQADTVDAVPADQIQVHFSKVYLLAGECVLECTICGKPTVVRIPCSQDAVEVVRCKGCRHWRHSGKNIFGPDYGTCVECLMDTKADFFCGFGERKTDGMPHL